MGGRPRPHLRAGANALDRAGIDALVADLVLPDGSAFGLLRSFPVRPRVSVALTWGNQLGIHDRIMTSGFDLHLVRPLSAEDIDLAMRAKLPELAELP